MEAADNCALVGDNAVFHEHLWTITQTRGQRLFLWNDVKGSCAAEPECKKKKEILTSKGNIAKMFLLLFAPVYKLFISLHCLCIVSWLPFGVYRFLFFVSMQNLLHYRVIFLYQKVFHTFMCSIDCTTVRYHTSEVDNRSALLLRGKGLKICCQTVEW